MLGVKAPKQSQLIAFLNPMRVKQVPRKIVCSQGVIKNWAMGHGAFRVGGNFGSLMPTVSHAKQNGFDDVLWTIDDYVQEMTILNVFFLVQNRHGEVELITPVADGTVFPGVHRGAVLGLMDKIKQERQIDIKEQKISIHELIAAFREGRLLEAFGCSTANFIQPIKQIVYRTESLDIESDFEFTKYIT